MVEAKGEGFSGDMNTPCPSLAGFPRQLAQPLAVPDSSPQMSVPMGKLALAFPDPPLTFICGGGGAFKTLTPPQGEREKKKKDLSAPDKN